MAYNNFQYKSRNGLIDVNTLSPSNQFYYLIQDARSLNPAFFGCRIAFFSINNVLIYHRKNFYALELHNKAEIDAMKSRVASPSVSTNLEIVKWSSEGNMAYINEYLKSNALSKYESVFLNLKEFYCFRIDETKNNYQVFLA